MARRTILYALSVLMIAARCAGQEMLRPPGAERSPFELSLSQGFDAQARPLLVVGTSIPYRGLVFLKRNAVFEARYRVYMECKDSRGKRVRGEVWEESVSVGSFKETTSNVSIAASRKSFPIEPGYYTIEIAIEIMDTSRRFVQEQTIRILGQGEGKLVLSALVFSASVIDSLSKRPPAGEILISLCPPDDAQRFRVAPGGIYGDFTSWPRATCSVVAPPAEEQASFTLSARIRDSRGKVILYGRRLIEASLNNPLSACLDFAIDHFPIGEYELAVAAEVAGTDARSEVFGTFTVLMNRALMEERFDDLLEMLSAVAEKKEINALANAPPAERVAQWARFWRKRDPTPSTEANEEYSEFLQRLKFVLHSFSRFQPGWRTDMGKTYLKYGSPDKVDEKQSSMMGTYYQLWYYYSRGMVFIFEDAMGTGEYRLLETRMI
jgi:GWxTD domain-containing protein